MGAKLSRACVCAEKKEITNVQMQIGGNFTDMLKTLELILVSFGVCGKLD